MIIPPRKLHRIFILSLVTLLIFLSGCSSLFIGPVPLNFTHVTTVPGPLDIGEPFGIAVKDDVIYISDGDAGTIRRIGADGNATTIASGLNTPSAIAFLPTGELVVADTSSHTIRKIDAEGTVTILAGIDGEPGFADGPALAATFNAPIGIAVTNDGGIYVSDTYNDRIRMIRDGVVSTIAGGVRGFSDGNSADAKFDTPLGIAVWDDKLLVADSGNGRIRILEPSGDVHTLAGTDERDLVDGTLSTARFVMPTGVAVDELGRIFVSDGNAIRVIGQRIFPFVETLAGDRRGYKNGNRQTARFSRPSGLAVGSDGQLYVADSDNRTIRIVDGNDRRTEKTEVPAELDEEPMPLATRWPFDPPSNPREVAGTLGEVRGDVKPDDNPVWFHNGLDIAGAYGETARFLRDETVLDPHAAENFGTSRELLRMPLLGYIHLRLGRDKDDRTFGDSRFQFEADVAGELTGLRIRRGTKFTAGDTIGTLNSMNHVHLIAGRTGREINALAAISFPGIADSIPPVIEDVSLFNADWQKLEPDSGNGRIKLAERSRVVVRAYDRMNGNSERRRLGVHRIGYQLVSNAAPIGEIAWTIKFARMPSNEAVRFAYADGSRSGYTSDTIFNYIATNRIDGDSFGEGFLDASTLATGSYTVRVFAADYFGNMTSKDIEVVK